MADPSQCLSCGASLSPDDIFCPACGAFLEFGRRGRPGSFNRDFQIVERGVLMASAPGYLLATFPDEPCWGADAGAVCNQEVRTNLGLCEQHAREMIAAQQDPDAPLQFRTAWDRLTFGIPIHVIG